MHPGLPARPWAWLASGVLPFEDVLGVWKNLRASPGGPAASRSTGPAEWVGGIVGPGVGGWVV